MSQLVEKMTQEECDALMQYVEQSSFRWKIAKWWIIIFTIVVCYTLFAGHEARTRAIHERDDQIAAIKRGQYNGCLRGNERFVRLFNIAVVSSAKAETAKNHTKLKDELVKARERAKPYVKASVIPCKKLIYSPDTANKHRNTHPPDAPPSDKSVATTTEGT